MAKVSDPTPYKCTPSVFAVQDQTVYLQRWLQEELDDRFKWDPSNARWVRVKPGKDEGGTALPCMPIGQALQQPSHLQTLSCYQVLLMSTD